MGLKSKPTWQCPVQCNYWLDWDTDNNKPGPRAHTRICSHLERLIAEKPKQNGKLDVLPYGHRIELLEEEAENLLRGYSGSRIEKRKLYAKLLQLGMSHREAYVLIRHIIDRRPFLSLATQGRGKGRMSMSRLYWSAIKKLREKLAEKEGAF